MISTLGLGSAATQIYGLRKGRSVRLWNVTGEERGVWAGNNIHIDGGSLYDCSRKAGGMFHPVRFKYWTVG